MSVLGEGARGPVGRALRTVIDRVRTQDLGGAVADYIPELAKADPERFGISVASVFGRSYSAGDSAQQFTIQSISKPFVYALALGRPRGGRSAQAHRCRAQRRGVQRDQLRCERAAGEPDDQRRRDRRGVVDRRAGCRGEVRAHPVRVVALRGTRARAG
ncbi:hypothetical protein HA402_007643 [Bradysia odoriphaga]|nr:hypothetical protein HA402_007643 [Bradysia odoriphaga]